MAKLGPRKEATWRPEKRQNQVGFPLFDYQARCCVYVGPSRLAFGPESFPNATPHLILASGGSGHPRGGEGFALFGPIPAIHLDMYCVSPQQVRVP